MDRNIIRSFLTFLIGLLLMFCMMTSGLAQERNKLAQTGFQFLSVISDGQAAAVAGAMTSREIRSSSLFFNPAGMATMSGFLDFSASINQWIADIEHNTLSLSIRPVKGLYGVLGFSMQTVNYGEVLGTVVANNELGYIDTGVIKPTAYAFGVGYAKALSDRFAVGGQVKWTKQDFDNLWVPDTDSTMSDAHYNLTVKAYDFGILFKTRIKSLTYGMSVRNFSEEVKYFQEGFQLPLAFTLGISMDLMDIVPIGGPAQLAIFSIDATHYRSHSEQIKVGLDYQLMNLLSIRVGYVGNNDENDLTFGFGISLVGFSADYAYTPFGVFDNVQRMTVRFTF